MMGRPSNAIWLILGRFLLRALGHFVAGTLAAAGALAVWMILVAAFVQSELAAVFALLAVIGVLFKRCGIIFLVLPSVLFSTNRSYLKVAIFGCMYVAWIIINWVDNKRSLINIASIVDFLFIESLTVACLLAWFEFKLVRQIFGGKK